MNVGACGGTLTRTNTGRRRLPAARGVRSLESGASSVRSARGGSLASAYKKWTRALAKAKTSTPKLDLKKYDRAEEDLKRHVFKLWGK